MAAINSLSTKPPRKENYFEMWQTSLCPKLAFKTFTFVNVLVQLLLFFVSVAFSGTDEYGLNEQIFLGNNQVTLD